MEDESPSGRGLSVHDVTIVPVSEEHFAGVNRCVCSVAMERRYIGLVEGPTLDQTQEFIHTLISNGGVQFVAVDREGSVVGWCDISRGHLEGFRHSGVLGMGLLSDVRGRGLGRRLAEAAIQAAMAQGMERIELEVFASNAPAIALYERLGFQREGVRRKARKLDGSYEDNIVMALLTPPP